MYRLSASVDQEGWDVALPFEVVAAGAGETVGVSAYATAATGAAGSATVTITATSESDPDVSATVEVEVTAADLAVTLDTAAALVDDYHAAGVLTTSERMRLHSQLRIVERTTGRPAHAALDRFEQLAEGVAGIGVRNLASAALGSVAGDIRAGL